MKKIYHFYIIFLIFIITLLQKYSVAIKLNNPVDKTDKLDKLDKLDKDKDSQLNSPLLKKRVIF